MFAYVLDVVMTATNVLPKKNIIRLVEKFVFCATEGGANLHIETSTESWKLKRNSKSDLLWF